MKQTNDFKEFAKYASLNIMGMIGLSCYILADTFFISKGLGADGLAALNLALPVYSVIHGSGLMLGMGGATKYSIFKGQKEPQNMNRVFTNVIGTAFVLAVIFMLTGVFGSEKLAVLLGADERVFQMTNTYLKVMLVFTPAYMLNNILLCFVRNDGDPKLSMMAMLGGSMANIVLDYVFIFPCGMGMFGAILATGFAPLVSMSILSVYFRKKRNQFHLKPDKPDFGMIRWAVSLGFPSLITEISSGVVILVFNAIILGLLGNIGVAAYGVVANLSLVVIAIYTGIAQGVQPLMSRAYGKYDIAAIQRVLRYAVVTLLVISGVLYLGIALFADPITGIFNSEGNAQLQEIAVQGMRLYFMAAPFVGFNIVISVFFTSTERAIPAHVISLLRGLFIIIPMAFFLSAVAGITGVWLTFPVTEAMVCVLGIILYGMVSRSFRPRGDKKREGHV